MCITSTARRRSLTLQVLPSHILTASAVKASSHGAVQSTGTGSSGGKNQYYLQQSRFQPMAAASAQPHQMQPQHPVHRPDPSHSHVVQHHYHDHSTDPTVDPSKIKHKAKGGVITPFPVKLHEMLDRIEADGLAHVVSWQPHGRCFVVHKPKEFVNHVMPKYFKQTKMASFQRQLNLYGFNRLTSGLDKGGYYHELFLRGKVSLAYDIQRMRVKGTGVRLPTNPDNEPNFYALPPVRANGNEYASKTVASMPAKPVEVPNLHVAAMPPLPPLSSPSTAKVPAAKSALEPAKLTKKEENDLIFFEGCPFHYLDPSVLAPTSSEFEDPLAPVSFNEMKSPARNLYHANKNISNAQQPPAFRPKFSHSNSTVVSDSEHEDDCSEGFVPSFSAANMDWEGPLSCPTIQAHMRRTSFRSFAQPESNLESTRSLMAPSMAAASKKHLDDDIETFFEKFDMPVDLYHEQIEHMCENDDTAFGYLLEQAISE
ncbi:hypothetical protein ACHAXS_004361 [Conticribra weissflogii]